MVILTTREGKRVLPAEAGFTLKLNGGIFNGMPASELNGNLIINAQSASGKPKIDGEEAQPDWQIPLTPVTWTIAGTGTTSWRGTLEKIGLGTVAIYREKGAPVIINSTTDNLKISGGTVDAGGTADPFTDTSTGLSLDIIINSTAPVGLLISSGKKTADQISGTGNVTIGGPAGTELVVTSITSGTLSMNPGTNLTIKPIPGGYSTGVDNITPVPEPSTFILLILGAAGLLGCSCRWRK
jgi:hypothetical protein